MNDPENKHVAVIGAGIVGVCSALALRKQGFNVTLIDRIPPGQGCSFGNAGLLAGWSFTPVAGPSALKQVPKWLLDPLGPLTIRWRHLGSLAPWLLRLLGHANEKHVRYAAGAMSQLTMGCADRYAKLATEAGVPELVRMSDVIYVYADPGNFEKAKREAALKRDFGVLADEMNAAEVAEAVPGLNPDFKFGIRLKGHGYTPNPGRLVQSLATHFEKLGGQFQALDVSDIRFDGDRSVTILGEECEVQADRLLVAAGAFSTRLTSRWGDKMPLNTERGYHAMLNDPGIDLPVPIGAGEAGFILTPMEDGIRLAGTVEFANLDAAPDPRRAQVLIEKAKRMFPALKTTDYSDWMGRRPTFPDSLPVVGPSPRQPNVFYAFGHQHVGLTCGAATAEVITDLISGRQPNMDVQAFSAARFS